MIWIEILGPSGIGKSYWYNLLIKKHPELDPQDLVLRRIYESSDYDPSPLKYKLMFFIWSAQIFKISNLCKRKLFNYFLKKIESRSKTIYPLTDEIIIQKYLSSIIKLNERSIFKLKKIHYYHDKLKEFNFYQHYLKQEDIYIAEDGLLHLSPIFIEEMQPNKILIFEKDYEEVENQRLNRVKDRPTTYIEFLYDENQLKKFLRTYNKIYDGKIKNVINKQSASAIKKINLTEANVIEEIFKFISEPLMEPAPQKRTN